MKIDRSGPIGKVLNLRITTGQFCSTLGLLESRFVNKTIEINDDGKQVFFTTYDTRQKGPRANLYLSDVERLGKQTPFRTKVGSNRSYRYRKNSSEVSFSFMERRRTGFWLDDRCVNGPDGYELPYGVSVPEIDSDNSLTNIIPSMELALPYRALKGLVQKYGKLLFVFKQKGFGIYQGTKLEPVKIPNALLKKYAYYHKYGEYCVLVSKEDVLAKCTRGLCKNNSTVLVGVNDSSTYLGFISGENWGRAIYGKVNKMGDHRISPAFFDEVGNHVQAWTPPEFDFDFEIGSEKMNETEIKIMRSWWNAYIIQQAKKGAGVDPDHKEVAEKYLQ